MIGIIEDDVLRFEGLSDADIATVNKRLPDVLYYLQLIKREHARLDSLISDLEPIAEKLIAKQQEIK